MKWIGCENWPETARISTSAFQQFHRTQDGLNQRNATSALGTWIFRHTWQRKISWKSKAFVCSQRCHHHTSPRSVFFCCGFQFHVQDLSAPYYPIPVETNVSNVMFIWKYHIASTFLPSDVHLTTITLPPIALCFTGNEPL